MLLELVPLLRALAVAIGPHVLGCEGRSWLVVMVHVRLVMSESVAHGMTSRLRVLVVGGAESGLVASLFVEVTLGNIAIKMVPVVDLVTAAAVAIAPGSPLLLSVDL